jgi:hypothetical protein
MADIVYLIASCVIINGFNYLLLRKSFPFHIEISVRRGYLQG